MTTQLQITCIPTDWDASTLTACGIVLDGGLYLEPRNICARDLPADLLAVWHEAVKMFCGLDPGGWAARHITANPGITGDEWDSSDPSAVPPPLRPCLDLDILRRWDDGRLAPPLHLRLDSSPMLDFFDALTSPGYWLADGQ